MPAWDQTQDLLHDGSVLINTLNDWGFLRKIQKMHFSRIPVSESKKIMVPSDSAPHALSNEWSVCFSNLEFWAIFGPVTAPIIKQIWRNIHQIIIANNFSSNHFPVHTLVFEKVCADAIVCLNLQMNELKWWEILLVNFYILLILCYHSSPSQFKPSITITIPHRGILYNS
jgi:hypothetical protein